MAIVTTKREAQIQAAEDTAIKMKLEGPFAAQLRKLFREIGFAFAGQYIRDGSIIDLKPYRDDFIGILRQNYRKIADKFAYRLIKDIDQKKSMYLIPKSEIIFWNQIHDSLTHPGLSEEQYKKFFIKQEITDNEHMEMLIDAAIATEIIELSKVESDLILETTEKDIVKDINQTITDAALEGESLDNVEIAELSRRKFVKNSNTRSQTISETETETMAEQSKETELDTLSLAGALIAGIAISDALEKTWLTVGDNKVRPAHIAADEQTVNQGQSFIVGGELLRFPGDPTASAANRINCRCNMVISKKK